jgi:hypothetical protein
MIRIATSNGRHKRCDQWMIAAGEGRPFWLKLSAGWFRFPRGELNDQGNCSMRGDFGIAIAH